MKSIRSRNRVPSAAVRAVKHQTIEIDGNRTFYREAGPDEAPVLLLPHGYPCSSFEFRNLMPELSNRWRTIAPDFPGFGYSDTPDRSRFAYDFNAYADFLESFLVRLGVTRFAIYLHDYGSQIGLRLAIRHPESIAALIIQNGDIYEDALGPKYDGLKSYFADPTPDKRQKLVDAISEEGFQDEFLNDVRDELKKRIPPDLWTLHWPLMDTPDRRAISIGLMEGLKENLEWFPYYQAYLRERRPPTLVVWGRRTATCPSRRHVPICATCRTLSCIYSTAVIGCSRPTLRRWWR
jgi:pimeloyl-ACP methyl ester carboxylesterase